MPSTGPTKSEAAPAPAKSCFVVDVALRVLIIAATLTGGIVLITSKQKKLILVPGVPYLVPHSAKFTDSPAFLYLGATHVVACLYSLITAYTSFSVVSKPICASTIKYLLHLAVLDTIMLGLMATGAGVGGGVGYVGLKGNPRVYWGKICNRYDKFCMHMGSSLCLAVLASLIFVILIVRFIFSLYKRIP